MWELKELTFILFYSEYAELLQERELWSEKFEETEISRRFPKKRISFSQVIIPGAIPDFKIEFFEGEDKNYENPLAILGIDVKSIRLIVRPSDTNITNYKSCVQDYLKLFLDIWNAFNKVAQIKTIERVGLVLIFTESPNIYSDIKEKFLKEKPPCISEDKDAVELRFSEFVQPSEVDRLTVFRNTLIAPNVFLIPKYMISAKNKDATRAEVQAIFDIACLPSSRGIIEDVNRVEDAFEAFIWLADNRISWFREVMGLDE